MCVVCVGLPAMVCTIPAIFLSLAISYLLSLEHLDLPKCLGGGGGKGDVLVFWGPCDWVWVSMWPGVGILVARCGGPSGQVWGS